MFQHLRRRGRGGLENGMLRVQDVRVLRHKVLVEGRSRRPVARSWSVAK